MRKSMNQISVYVDDDGNVVLTQEVHDLNEPDPKIVLSPEQAPLLASWIYDAGREGDAALEEPADNIPVSVFAGGPMAEPENLEVFHNAQGMVILKFGDSVMEISPAMAKRLREHLSHAIRSALTEMLRPDAET